MRECIGQNAAVFLFLNSTTGYHGDLVLNLGAIPCIPTSSTVQSVVSFSQLVRANAKQLGVFQAVTVGQLVPKVARTLEKHVQSVQTLTPEDHELVLAGLAQIV